MKRYKVESALSNSLIVTILTLLVSCGGGGEPAPDIPPQSDLVPDSFVFTDQIDVELATLVQSDSITISGIDAASSISVTGGEYSIDGGTFVSTDGTVTNGQSIIVQQTSASTSLTATDLVLTVGGVSDTFSITTVLILNADFVEKTEIVTISGVDLFEGHVNIDDAGIIPLDVTNLESGDLLTVDIEFNISELLVEDFVFSVQLMPQSVVRQFGAGSTLGEVLTQDFVADEGEELIDLGGVHIVLDRAGANNAVFQTKLPALSQDIEYRVVVTPDISFLATGQKTQREELALIPIFIKPETLSIKRLEAVVLNVIEPPVLLDDNDFTHLEVAATFESNGFSSKPIFQTHIAVDVTSFNEDETLELSMSWTTSKGDTFQLGLMGIDENGLPIVLERPSFLVPKDGAKSVQLPVVAYLTEPAHASMLAFSTSIRDIVDRTPETANFIVEVNVLENGVASATPLAFDLNLPMINQDLRATIQSDSDIIKYTVLRAGDTNSACLTAIPDIDSGVFTVDSFTTILASSCQGSNNQLWRYDFQTKQLIHRITDENGDNYCIEFFGTNLLPDTYRLGRCRFDTDGSGIGHAAQRFLFENGEVIVGDQIPLYFDVQFDNSGTQAVSLTQEINEAPNFFSDTNGADVDRNGRLFYIGDNSDLSIGNANFAQAGIAYGGEAYVDYQPVAGIGASGSANLFVSLFDESIELASASFEYQKHLSRQLTSLSGNISPVDVKNGKQAKFVLLGVESSLGEMKVSSITESYNPLQNLATFLSAEEDPQEIAGIDFGNDDYDQSLFSTTIIVYGIPVTVAGRLEGALTLKGSLNELQPFGLNANLESRMFLEATLSASVDAFVASAGVEAAVTVIDKRFSFDETGQFSPDDDFELLEPEIKFSVNADLNLDIDVLKGRVEVFVEYPRVCICRALGETVRRETILFESGSLFSYHNNFIEGSATEFVFKL
jgi:hypothetical protein